MKEVHYFVDLEKDPKGLIRMVRDDLKRIISSPGATRVEQAKKKIRFYEWCLEADDGLERFKKYIETKRASSEEAGFRAAGWIE